MIHKASMVMAYRIRLLAISAMLLLFTAWCAYDGFVAYPHEKERYEAYRDLEDPTNPDWQREWNELAASKGWETTEPGETTQMDIYTQFIMGGVLAPFGLVMLAVFIITGTKWVGVEEDALVASGGKRATWDDIRDIDKSRWGTKGIAVVYYGSNGKITLDDWKYERDTTGLILEFVEEKTGLGGEDETPAADTEAKASHDDAEAADADQADEPTDAADTAEPPVADDDVPK